MVWASLHACAQPYHPDSVATMDNSLGLVGLHWWASLDHTALLMRMLTYVQ